VIDPSWRWTDPEMGHELYCAGHLIQAGVATARATGDEALLASMLRQWDDLASAKSYLTGGIGSRHYGEAIGDAYELPPDRAYCETCASIASMMWNWRMLLVTGESRFADLFERTLYNGFLSGLSLDGESFFYANPLQSRTGEHRHRWNRVACCPPNIMRLLASLHHYLATVTDDGIQLHQYASSRIRAGDVVLSVETAYPWDGTVRVEVVESPDREWTLALRIPGWAREATLDGEAVAAGGYAEVRRRWRDGTQVVLLLDVSPRPSRGRCWAASRSSAGPWCTASSSPISRLASTWPTSPPIPWPIPSTTGRSRSWAACPVWP